MRQRFSGGIQRLLDTLIILHRQGTSNEHKSCKDS